jgi:uncharacterized delta-60 repeat protein
VKTIPTKLFYEFADFRLDTEEHRLFRAGEIVSLTPKAVEVLTVLIQQRGKLVAREELMNSVWCGATVEPGNLDVTISRIRKALGENGIDRKFIETVPRLGYKFVTNVDEVITEVPVVVFEKQTSGLIVIDEQISSGRDRSDNGSPHFSRAVRNKMIAVAATVLLLIAGLSTYLLRRSTTSANSGETPRAILTGNPAGFGGDGIMWTNFGFKLQKALAIALQPDGKIVAGGWVGDSEATSDFALARYYSNGELDLSFHGDGKVVTSLGERTDILYGLTVQSDGKILAVGTSFYGPKTRRLAVVRYKTDGALDASFHGDGIVTLNVGTTQMDTAYAVCVQPDGKIVIAGSALMRVVGTNSQVSQNDFALVRLNADGSLDETFGDDGKVITDFGFGVDVAYALGLRSDGRIVLAGVATNGTDQDFALAQYQSDGALDRSFGDQGKVRTDFFADEDLIDSLTIQPDGKILVAGYATKSRVYNSALARYSDDGSLDDSFHGNGKLTFEVKGNDIARGVALQQDGRIVVGIYANHGMTPEFAFARLLADGKLDETFYGSGKTSITFRQPAENFGIALTRDGYAISAGGVGDRTSSYFALSRVFLN